MGSGFLIEVTSTLNFKTPFEGNTVELISSPLKDDTPCKLPDLKGYVKGILGELSNFDGSF